MDELIEFLRARLDEDEATARACTPGAWTVSDEFASAGEWDVAASDAWVGTYHRLENAEHIVRHDPAAVLADVEAKRQIVEHCRPYVTPGTAVFASDDAVADRTLRLLALPYNQHEDYREEWRP